LLLCHWCHRVLSLHYSQNTRRFSVNQMPLTKCLNKQSRLLVRLEEGRLANAKLLLLPTNIVYQDIKFNIMIKRLQMYVSKLNYFWHKNLPVINLFDFFFSSNFIEFYVKMPTERYLTVVGFVNTEILCVLYTILKDQRYMHSLSG